MSESLPINLMDCFVQGKSKTTDKKMIILARKSNHILNEVEKIEQNVDRRVEPAPSEKVAWMVGIHLSMVSLNVVDGIART